MKEVRLTDIELKVATIVGKLRSDISVRNNFKTRVVARTSDDAHISGALGEIAVAKCIDAYWNMGINTFHGADIGNNIQVRTRSKMWYDLIVRKDDAENEIFVLAIDQKPIFYIVGWIYGIEARKKEFWKEYGGHKGAWFVPQRELKSIDTLIRKIDP